MAVTESKDTFYVYILECVDHSLYTGYTTDIDARINKHNAGLGAKYTRGRRPVTLRYVEMYDTKSDALKREYAIKQLSKQAKMKLIGG
ncbi:GIY-YIG nuclease family protein [Jeotgalicoccus meleagridis]|jgi:putative endonuclease|uniref:GIY-YIG nuclease superfamily protein n=1 Tax=Jeotgalicoccus meleagridis TaxID=2759181 RepID=A0A6V7RAR0_9STAP|nr:GIY-YIG nuclease family protein [Jeotgalicoccus meleagridis]CAD2074679.1 GIY-YIG nuclease superfamily protein [Jeotgalicoccus meleagridis]HIW37756.1 GIY-YIG nuclease family protein [Candidatus Jeotgalicoccus stercoravium]